MRDCDFTGCSGNCRHDWSYFSSPAAGRWKRASHLGTSADPMCGAPGPPCENASMCPTPSGRRAPTGSVRAVPAPTRSLVEHDGPVTVVTINRPERRNAVDSVCADQLREAFLAFDGDDERSVAVLAGAARDLLRRRRPEGGGRGGPPAHPRPRARADGADPADPGQARHRRRRGVRRGRRHRARALVRPAGGRRGRRSSGCSAGASACRCATSAPCGSPASSGTGAPWT